MKNILPSPALEDMKGIEVKKETSISLTSDSFGMQTTTKSLIFLSDLIPSTYATLKSYPQQGFQTLSTS